MKLPMVVSDLAVLREVLASHGPQTAIFVDPFDVDGWAAAIRRQIEHPLALDAISGFAQAIARRYSRKRMIDSYLKLLSPDLDPGSARLTQGFSA